METFSFIFFPETVLLPFYLHGEKTYRSPWRNGVLYIIECKYYGSQTNAKMPFLRPFHAPLVLVLITRWWIWWPNEQWDLEIHSFPLITVVEDASQQYATLLLLLLSFLQLWIRALQNVSILPRALLYYQTVTFMCPQQVTSAKNKIFCVYIHVVHVFYSLVSRVINLPWD